MITAHAYVEAVRAYFAFLVSEFAFAPSEETASGTVFYDLRYRSATQVVSISYENIEDYLLVIVYQLVNQQLPGYDDKRHTLHLNVLNQAVKMIASPADWQENQYHFRQLRAEGAVERKLLKSAKELRLCLTHFDKLTSL